MSKLFLFVITISLIVTGCGEKSSSNNIIEERYSSNPIFLENDSNFKFSEDYESLENFNFFARDYKWKEKWIYNVNFSQFKIPFKNKNNKLFDEISYSTHIKIIKDGKKVSNVDVVQNGYLLPLSNGSSIKKNTLQSVGLNVLYAFKKVNTMVKKISPSIPNLKRVHFSLLPRIEEVKEVKDGKHTIKKVYYHVNNATYRSMESGEGIISFFPQSKEAIKDKDFGGVPLWEMPWVTAHEYGHHIFNTIFPYYDELGAKSKYGHHNCWLHKGESHIDPPKNNKEIYKSRKLKFIRALNEAFSDLFAFYSIHNKKELSKFTLKGISYFEKTRNIISPVFISGDQKILNEKHVNLFFDSSESGSSKIDRKTKMDLSEIHHFGALVAHDLHSIFEKTKFKKSEYYSNHQMRVKVLVEWLKLVKKIGINPQESHQGYSRKVFESFKKALLKITERNDFSTQQYKIMKEKLPIL